MGFVHLPGDISTLERLSGGSVVGRIPSIGRQHLPLMSTQSDQSKLLTFEKEIEIYSEQPPKT
jgi:hypothetical protein